jgi:hypothetical protein
MKIKMVRVDQTEHEALCELRDVAHPALVTRHAALELRFRELDEINKKQVHMLNMQQLTVDWQREENAKQQKQVFDLQKRLQALEPVKIETEQPLFARKR